MSAFAALLRAHRNARRWSQERLAFESAMDHSLVSRLESCRRTPTPESVGKLALALRLSPPEVDHLWMAAGFLPPNPETAIDDEPDVLALYRLLRDERVPDSARQNARRILDSLVSLVGMEVA